MIGFESVSNCFRAVIVSDKELLSALVADTLYLGLDVLNVVGRASGANSTSAHSCDDLLVGNLD